MFTLDPSPLFWSTVRVTVPGQREAAEIELQFSHKPLDELRAWVERVRESNDRGIVAEVVRGWRGVDVEFSAEAIGRLMQNYPASGIEIFEQYMSALTESRAKN